MWRKLSLMPVSLSIAVNLNFNRALVAWLLLQHCKLQLVLLQFVMLKCSTALSQMSNLCLSLPNYCPCGQWYPHILGTVFLLGCTAVYHGCTGLYHGSTWLYFTILHCTMVILTLLDYTIALPNEHDSTALYYAFTLLEFTLLLWGSYALPYNHTSLINETNDMQVKVKALVHIVMTW